MITRTSNEPFLVKYGIVLLFYLIVAHKIGHVLHFEFLISISIKELNVRSFVPFQYGGIIQLGFFLFRQDFLNETIFKFVCSVTAYSQINLYSDGIVIIALFVERQRGGNFISLPTRDIRNVTFHSFFVLTRPTPTFGIKVSRNKRTWVAVFLLIPTSGSGKPCS